MTKFGGFGSGDQGERRISERERRPQVRAIGSVSLATTPATSTVITNTAIRSDSLFFWAPKDAGAFSSNITGYTVVKGQVTVTHTASASTRTFNYVAIA